MTASTFFSTGRDLLPALSLAGLVSVGLAGSAMAKAGPSGAVHLSVPADHRANASGKVVGRAEPANVWAARCVSAGRADVPDCSVEQRVILQQTGQLLAAVTVTLPHGSNKPTILVQVPLGLALDAGVVLKTDNHGPAKLRVQTCDQGGCYAATVMSPDFLKAMLTGKKLDVRFVGVNKKPVTVPMPLTGFGRAYGRIK